MARRKRRSVGDTPPARPPEILPYAVATEPKRAPIQFLIALILLGVAARFAVSLFSWGTTDAASFVRFAYLIESGGLLEAYRADTTFNHPPLTGYWCLLALKLARGNELLFPMIFRVPVILADVAGALLLARIALRRGAGPQAAAALAAAYACNLCAILVSGYHTNTDPVYAMLCLLAVYLLEDRRRPLLGGLALGLAINVKLIPVLLILPMCLAARSWKELLSFLGGLAVMAIPFLVPLLLEPTFARNVVAYRSQIENWGIPFLLAQFTGDALPRDGAPPVDHAASVYFRIGTWAVLVAVVLWSVAARRFGRWDRYQIATVCFALFLVLTPGFGVQYLVILAPLMYLGAPRLANAYGVAAGGAFLLAAYWLYWDRELPISSLFNERFPTPLAMLGVVSWGLLVFAIVAILRRRAAPVKGGR